MSEGSARGPNIRDIESLRIERPAAPPQKRRFAPVAIALVIALVIAAGGYAIYARTLGRPLLVDVLQVWRCWLVIWKRS